jgi:hypothetical protein
VKNRFQNLPFEFNLQRYNEGRGDWVAIDLSSDTEKSTEIKSKSKSKEAGYGNAAADAAALRRWQTGTTVGLCMLNQLDP